MYYKTVNSTPLANLMNAFETRLQRPFSLRKLAAAALLLPALAFAQPVILRVANQGDVLSLDPHSLNEAVQLAFLNNVFESLVTRGKDLKLVPSLATSWQLKSPTVWQFVLRRGVKFHDGSAFTADDVVFSLNRARSAGSDVRSQLATVKEVRKIDDFTVELDMTETNPILPDVITNILIMSKTWAEANNAAAPVDRRKGQENAASSRANGTGPFKLGSRAPGVRTTLTRNTQWWDKLESNLDEVVFQPVANDATRVAALLSGEMDVIDPVPLQDIPRVKSTSSLTVQQTPESRIIFLGFDQARDELLYSSVKGKNPFKDVRVRQAFYHAIDIEQIAAKVMRGFAKPTGAMISPGIRGHLPEMDARLPFTLSWRRNY
jgi:peptide/nickel transport system substrate-binding protein